MARAPAQQNAGCGADAGNAGNHQVVAYLRVSTDRQAEEGLGLEVQQDQIRAYLTKHPNLKLVKIYSDEGISGSLLSRPALDRLLADAKESRAFTQCLVVNLSRLARDLFIQMYVERDLMRYGVEVISLTEANGADAMSQAIRRMLGVFSEMDRSRIRDRTLLARRLKASRGGYPGGRPTTGYAVKNHELVIDPEGAKIIRYIRKLRMARLSFARISARLNAEGIKTRNGARWYASGVHRLIRSPVLRGKVRYGLGAIYDGIHPAIK